MPSTQVKRYSLESILMLTDFVPGYTDGVYNVSCIQGNVLPYPIVCLIT